MAAAQFLLRLKAHDVKGLLRRAKAYLGRHEYARARADLEQVPAPAVAGLVSVQP